jgi:uncharacterized membrane protein YphA (DoxX/SURF4 family)
VARVTLSERLPAGRLPAPAQAWLPWLTTAARLFLAYIWLAAGWSKFVDSEGTVRSVRAFRMLPEALVPAFAYALPTVELLLGGLLLLGLLTRIAAATTVAMMLMFIVGIGHAWATGLQIECGCFGASGNGVVDAVAGYRRDIARDVGFLLLAALLVWWPRTRLSLDGVLGLTPVAVTDPEG